MADIHVDDERLAELLAQAVKEMLANEESRLHKLSDGFLDEATKARRDALKDIEESREKFEARAREKLVEADAALATFNTSLADKRKKVEDALNVKIIAGFTAAVLIATLVAAGYFTDRAIMLNSKIAEATAAEKKLEDSSADLKTSLDAATKVYKTATQAADPASQLSVLFALATRVDADNRSIQGDVKAMKTNIETLQKRLPTPKAQK